MADRRVRRPQSRLPATSSCCSTRPRLSAAARSRRARRSQLADVCGYGYSRATPAGFGAAACTSPAPDGTPRAATLVAADRPEREVALRCCRARSAAAKRSSATRATPAATSPPPSPSSAPRSSAQPAATNPHAGPHLAPIRQRIESVFDLQRPAQPRTPRRPHTTQPLRPRRHPPARPRRLHQPQPPTRPTQPRTRRLHRLTAWHQPSSARTQTGPPWKTRSAPWQPG